jgi:DNA replication protein DnaC
MLDNSTAGKLREMKLPTMAAAFKQQIGNPAFASLDFEERFGLLVDTEWASRKNNHIKRLTLAAGFACPDACAEDIDYRADRELDKSLLARLGSCCFIEEHRNIALLGASGSGKTWLACAFGNAACRNHYAVRYIRMPDILAELAAARVTGTYRKAIEQYKKVRLLILDEWLLYPVTESDAQGILEVVERRQLASTIFCSQFDVAGWHGKLGGLEVADAICDRIAHNSYMILLKGESMRKLKADQ